MKTSRLAGILLFSGIFLLVSGIFLSRSVYEKVLELNGPHGMEKVVVKKGPISGQDHAPFTINDTDIVKDALEGYDLTYTASVHTTISGNEKNTETEVTGTSCIFPFFHEVRMIKGSFFTEKAGDEEDAVAVIDERLAVKLFNTADVIGNEIEIAGKRFVVIGVWGHDGSIIQKLTDTGLPSLYIPASSLFELYGETSITHLEVGSPYNNTMGKNIEAVSKALQAAGKNPDNYTITDFNIQKALLGQKTDIIVFLTGLIAIGIFFSYLKNQFVSFRSAVREELENDYIKNIIRANLSRASVMLLKTAAVIMSAFILWQLVKFTLYIPPEYIPSDISDIAYFSGLINKNIEKSNLSSGYIASQSEQAVNTAGKIIDFIFCVNLFPGFVLFYTGMYRVRALKKDVIKVLVISGIFMIISLAATALLCRSMGTGLYYSLKTLGVIWVFLSANVLKFGNTSGLSTTADTAVQFGGRYMRR